MGILGSTGLLLALAVPAQAGWRNFTTGDGLAANYVWDVIEDHSENMWFATYGGGVSRYDGVGWRTLSTADGLPSNLITRVFEDRSGVFWFGTSDEGVSRWDGRTVQTFGDGVLGSSFVMSITEDLAGNLWVVTWGGGAAWRDPAGSWNHLSGLPSSFVEYVFVDHTGRLWFGTSTGAASWDGPGRPVVPVGGPLTGKRVSAIVEDTQGNMWFASHGYGVARLGTDRVWKTYTAANGLAGDDVYSAFLDRSGALWFGTRFSGASRFDGALWRTFRQFDGLLVHAVTQDRSGNLWFACTGSALRYDGSSMRTFPELNALSTAIVFLISEDPDGTLWFGTESSGAWHFDGANWQQWSTATTANALKSNEIVQVLRDRAGNLWFPCYGGGLCRRDPAGNWRTFTTADGLPSNFVQTCLEDRDGKIWVAATGGVSRFDDPGWTTYTTANGLGGSDAIGGLLDADGNLWFSTRDGGLSRFDTSNHWRVFGTADGLAGTSVWGSLQDRDGNLWFACRGAGASRLDPLGNWKTLTVDDGLSNNFVLSMNQDRAGNLWFAQDISGGLSRFDGTNWRTIGLLDGLLNASVLYTHEDRAGNLWITTLRGLFVFEPDRVPPRTIFSARPPLVSASRHQSAAFAALGESDRLEFSWRLDGGAWSPWSAGSGWSADNLPDGTHVLEVRARDYWVNVDPTPEVATFEVDATPPSALIAAPAYGAPVRGTVEIRGTAADPRFRRYQVAMRSAGAPAWSAPLAESSAPVGAGTLASWDTRSVPDGSYELRVVVADTLDLSGTAQVLVVVDNQPPFFDQTTPVQVTAAAGGDIYTTGAEMHFYVPPYGFESDATVTIAPLTGADAPPVLSGAGSPVSAGYELDWGGARLAKAGALDVSLTGVSPGGRVPALYRSADGTSWTRLGGTVNGGRLSLPITEPGRYALYADEGAPAGAGAVAALSFTPRVFSPRGNYAAREVGIGFSLGRAAAVTVKVYDPSGRLVREVANGQPMGAGANLVRWDGHDRTGDAVPAGLYLVTVEALGEIQKKALAVVR